MTEMNFFYQRNAFDIHGMNGERDRGRSWGACSRVGRNLLAHCKSFSQDNCIPRVSGPPGCGP